MRSAGRWKAAAAGFVLAASTGAAACEPAAVATPTTPPSPTQPSGPNPGDARPIGSLHLTLKAPLPDQPVVIGYIAPDGTAGRTTDLLPDNHALTVSRTFVAGTYGLRANAIACGTFEIELNRETDVDLIMTPTGCVTAIVQVHGDEVTHPDPADSTGTILGSGPAHEQIRLIPLNVAEAPQVVTSDESGAFSFDGLLPGRYGVLAVGADGPAREIVVAAGETVTVHLPIATEPP